MRCVWVLLDGIGDVHIAGMRAAHPSSPPPPASGASGARDGATTLQAARTPHMDLLARHGLCGLVDSVEAGQACGSDTAHLSLLHYPPQQVYRGRGAFESMGSGLAMEVGDVAFKSNFATMRDGVVVKRRADRRFHEWGIPLCAALDGMRLPSFPDVSVSVRYATEHRCGVRLRGPGLSDCITGTDPLVDGRPLRACRPTVDAPSARRTCAVVTELSQCIQRMLEQHPLNQQRATSGKSVANVVLLRGAGARVAIPPFPEAHATLCGGGPALMVAPTAIIAGLGESAGFTLVRAEGATGDYRTDLRSKAAALVRAMRSADPTPKVSATPLFGFLHVKAVDDAGHDRDAARKVEWLRRADDMLGFLLSELGAVAASASAPRRASGCDALREAWTIVVTGDHSTPLRYGDHSTEPVPFVATPLHHLPAVRDALHHGNTSPALAALATRPDAHTLYELCTTHNPVRAFDELECARGVLGRFPGMEIVPLLERLRTALLGAESPAHIQSVPREPALLDPVSPMLPLQAGLRFGVSPWQEEVAHLLGDVSPPASTSLPTESEAVVIGAGLTGVSLALYLSRAGVKVVLLEAGALGHGATGRNGGHMHPINAEEVDAVRRLLEDVRCSGIGVHPRDLDFEPAGGLVLERPQSAHTIDTQPRTPASHMLSAQETAQRAHSPYFGPGLLRPEAGPIQPLKLLLALARLLRHEADVPVWQHTPALAVDPGPADAVRRPTWLVRTPRGVVCARAVASTRHQCVAARLLPCLQGHIVPVRNHLIMMQPGGGSDSSGGSSPTNAGALPWSNQSLVAHDGFVTFAQRSNGTAVLGGLRILAPGMDVGADPDAGREEGAVSPHPHVLAALRRYVPAFFPVAASRAAPSVSHAWMGTMAFTRSGSPLSGAVPGLPGQFVLAGFSGHGMPRCALWAQRLAGVVEEFLRTGKCVPLDLPREVWVPSTTPSAAVLRDVGVTSEQLSTALSAIRAPPVADPVLARV